MKYRIVAKGEKYLSIKKEKFMNIGSQKMQCDICQTLVPTYDGVYLTNYQQRPIKIKPVFYALNAITSPLQNQLD